MALIGLDIPGEAEKIKFVNNFDLTRKSVHYLILPGGIFVGLEALAVAAAKL